MTDIVDMDERRRDKMAAINRTDQQAEPELPLSGGGGGGTFGPMVPIKDYVDKADEAVETRLGAKLEKLSTKQTVWAAVATILGVLLAVLAFGGDRFDAGLSLAAQQQVQAARDNEQDRALRAIDQKLDRILAGQERPSKH